MPRKIELCEGLERRRLIALYKKLRGIVETQLEGLEKSEAGPSAAMLDSLCRSLKQLNGLLDDLSRYAERRERKEEHDKELSSLQFPFPDKAKVPSMAELDFDDEDHPALPFPVLRAGSGTKGV